MDYGRVKLGNNTVGESKKRPERRGETLGLFKMSGGEEQQKGEK